MIVKYDEDNFSIKLYRDFVKGKLVGLMEVIPIDELLEVWADRKTEPNCSEIPNNCKPQTYVINPQEPTNDDKCFECDDFFTCGGQCNKIEDEPQTDCAWKKGE